MPRAARLMCYVLPPVSSGSQWRFPGLGPDRWETLVEDAAVVEHGAVVVLAAWSKCFGQCFRLTAPATDHPDSLEV